MTRLSVLVMLILPIGTVALGAQASRPNILIAISDDQSWLHASAYGSKMVQTPNFDRVARDGVLVHAGFLCFSRMQPVSSGISDRPEYLADRTRRYARQLLRSEIRHLSRMRWPRQDISSDTAEKVGGLVTSKNWDAAQSSRSSLRKRRPRRAASRTMRRRFRSSLTNVREGTPFCFWFGSSDPHRGYEKGSGLAKGKQLADAEVPSFLPDSREIRGDMLDYAFEVERFDDDLGQILDVAGGNGRSGQHPGHRHVGQRDSDSSAKANCYEYGIHMPLAISWAKQIPAGRVVDDLVSFTDLTATIYDVTR